MIRAAQDSDKAKYMNMTAIATFFASVAATMIQYTYLLNETTIEGVANALILSSLIFSIASAANSLLAMAWRQSFVQVQPFQYTIHL